MSRCYRRNPIQARARETEKRDQTTNDLTADDQAANDQTVGHRVIDCRSALIKKAADPRAGRSDQTGCPALANI